MRTVLSPRRRGIFVLAASFALCGDSGAPGLCQPGIKASEETTSAPCSALLDGAPSAVPCTISSTRRLADGALVRIYVDAFQAGRADGPLTFQASIGLEPGVLSGSADATGYHGLRSVSATGVSAAGFHYAVGSVAYSVRSWYGSISVQVGATEPLHGTIDAALEPYDPAAEPGAVGTTLVADVTF